MATNEAPDGADHGAGDSTPRSGTYPDAEDLATPSQRHTTWRIEVRASRGRARHEGPLGSEASTPSRVPDQAALVEVRRTAFVAAAELWTSTGWPRRTSPENWRELEAKLAAYVEVRFPGRFSDEDRSDLARGTLRKFAAPLLARALVGDLPNPEDVLHWVVDAALDRIRGESPSEVSGPDFESDETLSRELFRADRASVVNALRSLIRNGNSRGFKLVHKYIDLVEQTGRRPRFSEMVRQLNEQNLGAQYTEAEAHDSLFEFCQLIVRVGRDA